MRNIAVVDAPSSLGLRPQAPGTVPGCYQPAGALREQRIVQRLGALEGGVVRSPRCVGLDVTVYDPDLNPDGTAGVLHADLLVAAFAEV